MHMYRIFSILWIMAGTQRGRYRCHNAAEKKLSEIRKPYNRLKQRLIVRNACILYVFLLFLAVDNNGLIYCLCLYAVWAQKYTINCQYMMRLIQFPSNWYIDLGMLNIWKVIVRNLYCEICQWFQNIINVLKIKDFFF